MWTILGGREEVNKELIKKVRLIPTIDQVTEICSQYGIGNLICILEVFENTANVNMKILTNTGTYVIRIFSADIQRVNFILSVLRTLESEDIPVLLPIKNIDGEHYIKFGSKLLQITRFKRAQNFSFDKKQAWSSGKTLYKFHDALSDIKDIIPPKASLYPSDNIIKDGLAKMDKIRNKNTQKTIDMAIDLYDEIVEKWESKSEKLPKTIIHGDWHQGNQLYSKSGNVCCIMDFDFITRAERIFDIAYSLWHFRIHKRSKGFYGGLWIW
mgnify:CR=1 FL=1